MHFISHSELARGVGSLPDMVYSGRERESPVDYRYVRDCNRYIGSTSYIFSLIRMSPPHTWVCVGYV